MLLATKIWCTLLLLGTLFLFIVKSTEDWPRFQDRVAHIFSVIFVIVIPYGVILGLIYVWS